MHAKSLLHKTVVGSFALLMAGFAFAQERDPALATELFNQARDSVKSGDHATACPKFAESQRLDPKVGTLLNLASCLDKIDDLAGALHALQQAVNLCESTKDRRLKHARKELEKLEPRVPRLTLELASGAPEGILIKRNAVELTTAILNSPLPVNPGKHVIEVTAPGHEPRTFEIELVESEHKTQAIAPGPAIVEPEPASAPTAPEPVRDEGPRDTGTSSGGSTLGWVLGGIGVAGLAVATVTGVMILGKNSTASSHCENNLCDAEGMDAAQSGKDLIPINTVAWAVGVVGIGSGAVLLLTSGPSSPSGESASRPSPPRGIGIQLGGTF
jgi:hypothetical protein